MRTNYRLCFPRPVLVQRSHEHFIKPESVCSICGIHIVRRDRIFEGLTHFPEASRDRLSFKQEDAIFFSDLLRIDVNTSVILVRGRLNVPLVVKPLEGFGTGDVSEVIQDLVPETGVEEMKHSMLYSTDIEINTADSSVTASHPVTLNGRVDKVFFVCRV